MHTLSVGAIYVKKTFFNVFFKFLNKNAFLTFLFIKNIDEQFQLKLFAAKRNQFI